MTTTIKRTQKNYTLTFKLAIVGYDVTDNLKSESTIRAYEMALKQRKKSTKLYHHEVVCSMTDGGNCYQNALAERVNDILKTEFLIVKPDDLSMVKKMVQQAVEIYNNKRPHLSLNYKTPNEVHWVR